MENIKVLRTDKETDEETILTVDEAVSKLDGYWEYPRPLLLKGIPLFTPYATYVLIEK